MSESNYHNAINALRLQNRINTLRCEWCDAQNRPGVQYVELEHGRCSCNSCGHDWPLKDEDANV